MKVIIDFIEGIREEIDNEGDFTFLAMLLKENSNGDMELVGEKSISKVGIVGDELRLFVEDKERLVFVQPVLNMLDSLENKEMMMPVKVLVSDQSFDVIGFGSAKEDKKFVVFLSL